MRTTSVYGAVIRANCLCRPSIRAVAPFLMLQYRIPYISRSVTPFLTLQHRLPYISRFLTPSLVLQYRVPYISRSVT
ncbi:MAG TPA: hypothetical protein IAA29_02130, partial [Candidatus Paenibacillus intestinavium]|nr:hypothetical protein [Candidatus Paenibacillus intestinavium]